ncbi:DedA family protein [Cellvibrio sp.]|uniref:DedA family protein n=1 Tax=Cellvibrio sp. TaxID=1965322 RepID=UPI0039647E9D
MEFIHLIIDFILHIDVHLSELFAQYGLWIYGILFLIIFCETGLVVTPFLPGDSLLFATGALVAISANSGLDVNIMAGIVIAAAVLGNIVNYTIGRFFGERLFRNPDSKIFRQDYLNRARNFYDKHGGVAIIMTRFIPIIRTFAPFVAGMSGMKYPKFIAYNIVGALLWVGIFLYAGYHFGNIPSVRKNFTLLIFGILVVSVLPIFYEAWKAHKESKALSNK